MGAEIIWLGAYRGSRVDPRPRCRYCARVLRPLTGAADEAAPHCSAPGCRICDECAIGATALSPVRRASR